MDYDEYNALKDPRIKKYVVQDREFCPTLIIISPFQLQNLCKARSALLYSYCQLLALSSSLGICLSRIPDCGFRVMTIALLLCSYERVSIGEQPPGTFCLSAVNTFSFSTGFVCVLRTLRFVYAIRTLILVCALRTLKICAVAAGCLDDRHRTAGAPSWKDVVDQDRGNCLRVSPLAPPLPHASCKPVLFV